MFPRIAETFATFFAYKQMITLTKEVMDEARKGDFSKLNEAHIIISSIKAVSTKDGINGIDILRRSAGGHGFSSYSAFPNLQLELAPTYTF